MAIMPHPRGLIPPPSLGLCASIHGAGIIPPRYPIPSRFEGGPIIVTDEAARDGVMDNLVKIVNEKLRLEDERVRRMLPALPAGYSWRGMIESLERVDFQSLEGSTLMRIVYRLYGPDGERLDISAREAWARTGEEV